MTMAPGMKADDHAGAPGPSPEELMEVMRLYKQNGGEMDPSKVPEDVRPFVEMFEQIELEQQKLRPEPGTKESLFDFDMGQQHMKQRGHSGGIHGVGGTTQEIKPEPGFVVKCRDDNDRKIFVNMCGSSSVPAPGNWDKNKIPEEVAKKLEKAETTPDESLRFPLSLSDAAYDLDKQGKPCTTFDCIFNLDVLKQAMETKALKVFLIELALGWVQEKHHLILDPKYKLPRMKYKGKSVQTQNIRDDSDPNKPKIEEISTQESPAEEATNGASFPLMATKRKHTVQNKARAGKSGGGIGAGAAKPVATAPGAGLKATVAYEGRPCEAVVVTVATAGTPAEGFDLGSCEIVVDDGGERLVVSFARNRGGEEPVRAKCELPFAVDSSQAEASVTKDGAVVIRLPYKPFSAVAEEMRAAAPHKFGALNLSDSSFLDLE